MINEERIKHLEMLQAIIARLANNSSLVKGWAVAAVGVLIGLAVNGSRESLALVAVGIALCFWGLDTYYLNAERLFRKHFDKARRGDVDLFDMNATRNIGTRTEIARRYRATFFRPTQVILYGALTLAAVATRLAV